MEVKEKRIIDSVILTQEEQNFLFNLVNVIEKVCETHPHSCENCPLADGWDCDSFKEITKKIAENGGLENEI